MIAVEPSVEAEADRLLRALLSVDCEPGGRPWNLARCREIAPLTLEIARLKRERNAVILAHSYVDPEIIYGVADFRGDSYFLSQQARKSRAETILFAGVVFMAETAKILSPQATVVVPDRGSGCSLADSIDGEGLRRLKALYPGAAGRLLHQQHGRGEGRVRRLRDLGQRLRHRRPDARAAGPLRSGPADGARTSGPSSAPRRRQGDRLLGRHLPRPRPVRPAQIAEARAQFPGLKVVAHPECPPEVAAAADFVGSTGAMMKYVKAAAAPYFLMLTECGLVGRLQVEAPEKHFIGGCRLCPYMKLNSLEKMRDALAAPRPDQIVTLDEGLRRPRGPQPGKDV